MNPTSRRDVPPRRGRRRDERGAVAPLVAILAATGVLTGMLAITVDVGNIWWERRQLQNGADAAAMSLAADCAGDSVADGVDCDPVKAAPDLEELLDGNAADDSAQLDEDRTGSTLGQCGEPDPLTGAMPPCTSPTSYDTLTDCPPRPDWLAADIPFVEVYSRTDSGDGSTVLPPFFAQTLAGGDPEASVAACARAAWGSPKSYNASVPLTISACEWEHYTMDGAHYGSPPHGANPGYGGADQPPWPPVDTEAVIELHSPQDKDGSHDCAEEVVNGKDTAGGFGYVDSDDCSALIVSDDWAHIDTGNGTGAQCSDVLAELQGTVVALPIFDCLALANPGPPSGGPADQPSCAGEDAHGDHSWYHVKGWATFYLSGYKLSGGGNPSVMPGSSAAAECTGEKRCLYGWFVKDVLADSTGDISAPGGPDDFGAVAVKLAG